MSFIDWIGDNFAEDYNTLDGNADAGILAAVLFTVSGTTPTIVGQKNVASITRDGQGLYQINFSSALPHANYGVLLCGRWPDTTNDAQCHVAPNRRTSSGRGDYSTTALDILCVTNNGIFDPERVGLIVYDPDLLGADYKAAAQWSSNGGFVTLNRQKRIGSISRVGAGDFDVNLSHAFPDSDYQDFSAARWLDSTDDLACRFGANRDNARFSRSTSKLDFCAITNTTSGFDVEKASMLVRRADHATAGTVAAVKFTVSGGVATIVKQHNVSGVAYLAAGHYRVDFTSTLADTNYAVFGSGRRVGSSAIDHLRAGPNRNSSSGRNLYSTSQCSILTTDTNANTVEASYVNLWFVKPWLT